MEPILFLCQNLINAIWNKEELPQYQKESTDVHVYKNHIKTDSSNYKCIQLLLHKHKILPSIFYVQLTSKILSNIIHLMLITLVDEIIKDNQGQFWHNRSHTDQIFDFQNVQEKNVTADSCLHTW